MQSQSPRWSPATRLAFRFCVVYLGLFCLSTQIGTAIIALPGMEDPPNINEFGPLRELTFWVGAHVFDARLPLVYSGSGSGDKVFDWAWMICVLVFSLIATGVWSLLDRRRAAYVKLFIWFRLFIRFALAGQLIVYGLMKVIPLQMPFPYLGRLIEPYGQFSPMGVLWSSIGSSPAYESFAGAVELFGGMLLILPRTTLPGSLIGLAAMIQVFALNMTYDVPVKILSFHLILLSLFLVAPDLRRLAGVLLTDRVVEPSEHPPLFRSPRANQWALAAQVLLGLWLMGTQFYGDRSLWRAFGPDRPKSPLYGIWNVEETVTNGAVRPPLATDRSRWRRIAFDRPGLAFVLKTDDAFVRYAATIHAKEGTIVFMPSGGASSGTTVTYQRDKDVLTLDGMMDGGNIHMKLRLFDHTRLPLVSRGFRWVQDYPFNH